MPNDPTQGGFLGVDPDLLFSLGAGLMSAGKFGGNLGSYCWLFLGRSRVCSSEAVVSIEFSASRAFSVFLFAQPRN
jgi:hypothetical protein